jgi:hypothetical protein
LKPNCLGDNIIRLVGTTYPRMVNWQTTAITLYCEAIKNEVTVIVYKDWSVKCTGWINAIDPPDKQNKSSRRQARCRGQECDVIRSYRERLRSEEPTREKGSTS